jgi:RimJ/RimL family protein N-acetyltransferase
MRNDIPGFLNWQISNYKNPDVVNSILGLGIFNKINGEIIGHAGIGQHDDLGETEIFYSILIKDRKKGYGTEAAKAVTQWALKTFDIPYIIGTASVDNIPSQRILEKCGYLFIDERELTVHILGKIFRFKYYRKSRE